MKPTSGKSQYSKAGVDIDTKMLALRQAKRLVEGTSVPGVMSSIGSFGGVFQSPGKDCALVSSTDGVGTKLKVAAMVGRHDTVGQDLVNHCVNDILVQGAYPLFFLDYFGTAKLDAKIFQEVVAGLCKACRENGCALIGGETAELPGLYPAGEYDLVGTIVGAVRKKDIVTGQDIKTGDVLIGLPSGGLQTNGYTLARKIIFEKAGLGVKDVLPGTKQTVGQALLAIHRSFLKPVKKVMSNIKVLGMAHITGGGFLDNLPRMLPEKVAVEIDRSSWPVPPLFRFLEAEGGVDQDEMYRVFNMGIGMVLAVRAAKAATAIKLLQSIGEKAFVIGKVTKGRKGVALL